MVRNIAIYGAGGFGKEVCCIINKINERGEKWKVLGFFDDGLEPGVDVSSFGKVLGGIDALNNWPEELSIVFAIGNPKIIQAIVSKISSPKIDFPNIIHPEVFFADLPSLKMGIGNVVVRGCSFSCDVEVGNFNQFNSISSLAHDCKVGDFNIFMPLVRVSGGTQIGNSNFFGINAVILQNVKIGNNIRLAAGSFLMTKTKDGFLYMGNPARKTDL